MVDLERALFKLCAQHFLLLVLDLFAGLVPAEGGLDLDNVISFVVSLDLFGEVLAVAAESFGVDFALLFLAAATGAPSHLSDKKN